MAKIANLNKIDPDKIAEVLREQAAIHIMPRFRQLKAHEIMTKSSPTDLVTVADQEMERALIEILPAILPGSIVVGEEGVSSGDISLEALDDTSRPVWVTDPVDGTHNFAHGKEEFCTMLALIVGGQTQMTWIYDPLTNHMMIAERGAGAYINGQKLKLSAPQKPLSELVGFVGLKYFPKPMRPYLQEQEKKIAKMTTISCAGHQYLQLAQDIADFAIYTRVKPWDHLAGQLMVEEAGGYLAKWDSTPYTPQTRDGGILMVTEKQNWQPLHDLFLKKLMEEYQQSRAS